MGEVDARTLAQVNEFVDLAVKYGLPAIGFVGALIGFWNVWQAVAEDHYRRPVLSQSPSAGLEREGPRIPLGDRIFKFLGGLAMIAIGVGVIIGALWWVGYLV